QYDQLLDGVRELPGLHVIGVAAKRIVLPRGVNRVLPRMPQAAERGHVAIANSVFRQRARQLFAIELRISPRARNGANIHQQRDAMSLQNAQEFFKWTNRMADGENSGGHVQQYRSTRREVDTLESMTYYGAADMAASFRTVRGNTITIAEEIGEKDYGFRA